MSEGVQKRKTKKNTKSVNPDPEKGPLLSESKDVSKKQPLKPEEEESSNLLKNEDKDRLLTPLFSELRNWVPIVKISILLMICALSFLSRLFSIIKFESVIHEYDPWFNFRSTRFMLENGVYGFWNWFDSESWFPLGRVVGGTVYPGLMLTSCFIKWTTDFLAFPIDIRNICVLLAPFMSMFQCISIFLLTKEATNRVDAGLYAALFMSINSSIMSRGVAGSYDNEAVAIWALTNTFYLWIKACNTGSILWSLLCTLNYFYMVVSWGGYSFIINIIPIFVLGCMFINKFNMKIYIAYSVFYTVGTICSLTIVFVNYQVFHSSEHMASHLTYIAMNAYVVLNFIKDNIDETQIAAVMRLAQGFVVIMFFMLFVFLTMSGSTKWSGRSLSLIDPSYAKEHMPLVASVSEHSPAMWVNYWQDLSVMILFVPLGFYYTLVYKMTHGKLFIAMYGIFCVYFSCAMIRLMLVLAPSVCILSGIAVSHIVSAAMKSIRQALIGVQEVPEVCQEKGQDNPKTKAKKVKSRMPVEVAVVLLLFIVSILKSYVFHQMDMAHSYSSPSIIMDWGNQKDGNRVIIDDFREAYYWLQQNTAKDAKILAWWDYGYQITGMSNRTTIVDNNTWNNTHIATVGKVLASNEEEGYELAKSLDVNYILVVFGGKAHYDGDDLAKFLWFVRIANSAFPGMDESSYYGGQNNDQFGVADYQLSEKMGNTLCYKFMYNRFGEVYDYNHDVYGWDRPREVEIGKKDIEFEHFREAYTSERWMVRIYELLPRSNRDKKFITPDRVGLGLQEPNYQYSDGSPAYSGGKEYQIFEPEL